MATCKHEYGFALRLPSALPLTVLPGRKDSGNQDAFSSVVLLFVLLHGFCVCLQRLGAPLLRIALDILVGPTSSQERLLAARVVQEVIPRYAQGRK